MPEVKLIWVGDSVLDGLDGAQVAQAAGIELDNGGVLQAAVVTAPEPQASPELRARLSGITVKWLDLAAEVGGGSDSHRLERAASAVARSAGQASLGTLPALYSPQPALNVLVAGAGESALAAVQEAAALGHPVTLATPNGALDFCGDDENPQAVRDLAACLPQGLEVIHGAKLSHLTGAGGAFRAWIKNGQAEEARTFGAVILAPPASYELPKLPEGLEPSGVEPLSGFDPEQIGGKGEWQHAVVLAGVEEPLDAASFDRAVRMALALQKRPQVQTYLMFGEARVAIEGGERRYRQARDQGVLCIRLEPGQLRASEGGKLLVWTDPVLNQEMELEPDLILAVEQARTERPEFLQNPVLWPSWQNLLPDGAPRFKGGRSARSGLYVLGALRGTPAGSERREEAAAACAELHDRLSGHGQVVPMPAVNHGYCASCLTCVRVCPHGVPRYPGDKIECAPAACVACGICAAECPAEAISPPGWSNPEMFAGLRAGLEKAGGKSVVLFACSQSAVPAMAQLSRQGHQWPAGLVVFPVNCAGRVGEQLILKSLSLGASGVLVAGCHDGNCRSVNGNLRAKLRTGQCAEFLSSLEMDPEMVQFLHMASNQPFALARAVDELCKEALK